MRAPWAVTSVPVYPAPTTTKVQPGRPLVGVVGVVGQLDLTGDVVAQVERLGDVAEAVRILRDTGDRQQLVDAAGREHHPVEGQLAPVALRVHVREPPLLEVDRIHGPQQQAHLGQRAGDGDGHPARVEDAGGHFGQQREVEEVVRGVDQDDLAVRHGPSQHLGRVVAGEARADDRRRRSAHGSSLAQVKAGPLCRTSRGWRKPRRGRPGLSMVRRQGFEPRTQ